MLLPKKQPKRSVIATKRLQIQSADTAACVKHYALNNQELDRGRVSAEVSERALREIYLPGFKTAVKAGEARTVTKELPFDDLCIWDDGWTLLLTDYVVSVGAASDDIRLTDTITLE